MMVVTPALTLLWRSFGTGDFGAAQQNSNRW